MRKQRIALLTTCLLLPAATVGVASETSFAPKTLTIETLAMTGPPVAPVVTFTPKTLSIQTLAMTGPPPAAPQFISKQLTMQTLGMTQVREEKP